MDYLTKQRHEDCLYWYLQTIKDLGKRAAEAEKCDLYRIAGERVYLSERYAARVIRRLIRDKEVMEKVSRRVV